MPQAPATRPYGRVRKGLYRHRLGKLIVQTGDWEGPRGGRADAVDRADADAALLSLLAKGKRA